MPAIERDGARVVYEVRGSGPRTILLAHNILCDRRVFDGVIARLDGGWRAIAVDLRGHGESPVPERAYSARDMADDLAALLDAEAVETAAIAGLSMGATVALEFALAYPKRVSSLLLLGGTARRDDLKTTARNAFLSPLVRAFGVRGPILQKAVTSLFGASYRAENRPEFAAWTEKIRRLAPRAAYYSLRAWRTRADFAPRLAEIAAPTLVVSGEEDVACTPAEGEELHRGIRGSAFVRLPRAGHTMAAERPAELAAVLREFLTGAGR
ncbi:MAG: alpha/beta fold hydrolase [Proteobacteria bacterium]|nr:alpha/beta fold hydrolase [Pseudomonadota bacterium]